MLSKKYLSKEIEEKWQKFWEDEGIYQFDPEGDGSIYSIDTPPPTVNGSIHIGHVYSYTQAEMIARFWRMKGRRVYYPFGFDDNGLPTERLVEREEGIKAKELKREEFNQLCLATTQKYEAEFKELWQSLGFSVDWDQEYSTMADRSRGISQLSFLQLLKQGRAYRSQNPVIWCPECQTSIAQAEIESRESNTELNYITFKTTQGGEIEIATTRPELLSACSAIFIHPEDDRYSNLVGQRAIIPLIGDEISILEDEDVEIDKGSGAVMCCTFGDQQDIIWWKKHNLPLKEVIDQDGHLKRGIDSYGGLYSKKARKAILKDLDKAGLLKKQEMIVHQIAGHERCGQPIEYLSSSQWFIKITDKKDKLLEMGEEINWRPEYMKHRYREWVENLEWDWCISRQRYFGVPFPIWYCSQCGEIITAREEELPINPQEDEPTSSCQCGSDEFIPEEDVMDTWATSSTTPLINARWQGDEKTEYPIIPMSLRPQAHDIIRTWTFYTIAKSLFHLGQIPWKNIMISGFVMADKGEKISKSKKNSKETPQELIANYSADAIRLWTASARLGTDILFSKEELKNNQRTPIKLWNAARFVLSHLKDFDGSTEINYEIMDQWILEKLAQTHKRITEAMEDYSISQARDILENFFWRDFCDNYLEIVKERLYKPAKRGEHGRCSAQQTLYLVLINILKCYAIFIPHITEEIYQSYFRDKEDILSIHLFDWARYSEFDFGSQILDRGEEFIEIASQVRRYKSEAGLSLGTELKSLDIQCNLETEIFLKKAGLDLQAITRAEELNLDGGYDELSITIEQ